MKRLYQIFNQIDGGGMDSVPYEEPTTEEKEAYKRYLLKCLRETDAGETDRAQQKKREAKHRRLPAGMAAAVGLIFAASCTVLAAGLKNYIRDYYESKEKQPDVSYVNQKYMDTIYDLPTEVVDGHTGKEAADKLKFEVLKAERGKNSFTINLLLEADEEIAARENWKKALPDAIHVTAEIEGGTKENFLWCEDSYMDREGSGLEDNQLMIFYVYHFSGETDLSGADDVELTIRYDEESFVKIEEDITRQLQEPGNNGFGVSFNIYDGEWIEATPELEEISESWRLTVPFQGVQEEKIYSGEEKVSLAYWEIIPCYIDLCPTSLYIEYRFIGGNVSGHYFAGLPENKIFLVYRDGSKICMVDEVFVDSGRWGNDTEIKRESVGFSVPIDIKDIVAVEFDGTQLPLK